MAIIKTYPLKSNYYGPDRLVLSDMQPDAQGIVHGTTKSLTLSNLKSFIGSGSDSFTLVVDRTSGAATFNTNTKILNIPDYSVGNVDGSGTTNRIPRWTDSNTLGDSQISQNASSIGIGTTAPEYKLDIDGDVRGNSFWFRTNTASAPASTGGFYRPSLGDVAYGYNASELFRILSSGNVGIGTTGPLGKLHVSSGSSSDAGNIDFCIGGTQSDARVGRIIKNTSTPYEMTIRASDFGTQNLLLNDNGGNVGIGTSSPVGKLEVAGNFRLSGNGTDNDSYPIHFSNTSVAIARDDNNLNLHAYNAIVFGASNTQYPTSTERMRIANSGNVGIGTTAPNAKLHIQDTSGSISTIRMSAASSNANYAFIKMEDVTANTSKLTLGATIGYSVEKPALSIFDSYTTLLGNGTSNGRLLFNCSANTHSVEIIGPDHSGGSSYSLKLPNSLPSVSNQILEANALGVLSWIPTPSGGGGGGGTLNTVGLTMPSFLTVGNSPLTGTGGTISVTLNGGSSGQFLDYQGNWSTPTNTTYTGNNGILLAGTNFSNSDRGSTAVAALDFFKTIATPTNDVVASGNDDTLTLAAGGNTGIFINGNGSQVTIGLYPPTTLALGGVKLVNATTQSTTANGLTTTAGRTYAMQLNSSGQAVVNVPWTGGGSSGISFSGTTSGGLATFTNSSTAGVSSKVTLNASGLIQLDADNAGGSRASIDYNPTGNRLQLGDFSTQGGIVELYTNGSRGFQIGINGELGLGTTASQGTAGQVLTSGGNGAEPTWTAKTTVPSNVVTGAGNIYEVPMWNPQNGVSGSYIGAGGGFNSSPFKSNVSGQSIISTEINGGITLRQSGGAQVKIEGSTGSGGAYQINLPSAVAASTSRVLGVNSVSGSLMSTAWVDPGDLTSITGTTSVNSTTFANTPFTFANTNSGSAAGAPVATSVANGFGNKHIAFYYATTLSGSISQSGGSAVAYNTSSDYRLKENVVDITDSVDRLKQLKPSRFNFITDGPSRTIDGFLAHEVSSIVPEAVTGIKDAVDADNNIIPQGIDQSKLVPLLVGAIKELTARIEALEA